MKSSSKHLRIASNLQIVLGIASILLTRFLIGHGDVSVAGLTGEQALKSLMQSYAGASFQIIAGAIGLALSNKKSIITVILGILLFIPQLAAFLNANGSIPYIVGNIILLAIPYYYLHNAYKNFKA